MTSAVSSKINLAQSSWYYIIYLKNNNHIPHGHTFDKVDIHVIKKNNEVKRNNYKLFNCIN